MIAEVCRFYGWTDSHVLSMPASRFFLMLNCSRQLNRIERVHACYIARTPAMDGPQFMNTVKWFDEFATGVSAEEKEESVKPKTVPRKEEALKVMRAFAKDRRIEREIRH